MRNSWNSWKSWIDPRSIRLSTIRQLRKRTTKMGSTNYATRSTQLLRFYLFCLISAAKGALCPEYSLSQQGDCVVVSNWSEFHLAIESNSKDELLFCPFDIEKTESDETATVTRAVHIKCKRTQETDLCIIRGPGTHLRVATSDDTLFQGIGFQNSNDHAVHVVSNTPGAESATHTFCSCSILE